MELVALTYILLGITVCSVAHLSSYKNTYEERLQVLFRFSGLTRWMKSIFKSNKELNNKSYEIEH